MRKVCNRIKCRDCEDLMNAGVPHLPEHEYAELREHCSDTPNLMYLKREVLDFLQECDNIFQGMKPKLSMLSGIRKGLTAKMETLPCNIPPSCHPLKKKLCAQFATSRVYIYQNNLKKEARVSQTATVSTIMGGCNQKH